MVYCECKECGRELNAFNFRDEVECEGCKLAQKRAYFENRWHSGGGFMKNICEAIVKADLDNLGKLYKAFPELVDGYSVYAFGKTWEQFQNDKRDI